jgi:hypothetical protein
VAKRPLPSPELLRQLLRYEPETGKLFWRQRPPEMFKGRDKGQAWNTRWADKEAFTSTDSRGYKIGTFLYHNLKAHRVIIAMLTGQWPPVHVDHDNGNRGDNRPGNIGPASVAQNCRNQALKGHNTSGVSGVNFNKKTGKWRAQIGDQGKTLYLGLFMDKADAISARKAAEADLGYHPNHGRPAPPAAPIYAS